MCKPRIARGMAVSALMAALVLCGSWAGAQGKGKGQGKGQGQTVPKGETEAKGKDKAKGEAKAKGEDKAKGKDKAKGGSAAKEKPEAKEQHGGLAMGKGKEKGEGLALGKDKEKGEGLALGKGKDRGKGPRAGDVPSIYRGKPIAEEQYKHLWRMVRIERLAAVAAQTGNHELVEKVRLLGDKEKKRHAKVIVRLRRARRAKGGAK